MQEQENKLRDLFLSSFVEDLIRNSYKKENNEPQTTLQQSSNQVQQVQIQPNQIQISKSNIQIPQPKIQISKPKQQMIRPQFNKPPQKLPMRSPITLPQRLPSTILNDKDKTINLGKVNANLSDPSVFSVESPGPGKNLIVNRAGKIQSSSSTLNKEEIDLIMKEVSDKTRIPLISGGVFRAAIKDLVITAVVSDYIGTRFLMQKRTPFQRF